MILYFIIVVIIILVIDFIVIWGLQGFSFKNFIKKLVDTTYWQKNTTYWQKKYNTVENELELQRKAHANNTIAWTKQIEDLTASEEYKTTKYKLQLQENKKLKERLKELEKCK